MQKSYPNEKIHQYVREAFEKFNCKSLYDGTSIKFSRRFTRRLASARYRFDTRTNQHNHVITFGTKIVPFLDEEELRELCYHETCHIAAPWLYRKEYGFNNSRIGHGPYWKRLMASVGYPNARACTEVNPNAKQVLNNVRPRRRKYWVACGCDDGLVVDVVCANRIKAGQQYRCRGCREVLRPERVQFHGWR